MDVDAVYAVDGGERRLHLELLVAGRQLSAHSSQLARSLFQHD